MIACRLTTGEEAELHRLEGERVALVSPRAFAPGAPLELQALVGGEDVPLRGKSLGSKRREDGRFDVRARLVSLRRVDRERLAQALG